MPIQVKDDRTNAYIGTFHVEDASDMLQLQEVHKMVRNMNKMLKEDSYPYRFKVTLRGRLGKNNPHARLYRYRRDVRVEHASRIDAYIHRVK